MQSMRTLADRARNSRSLTGQANASQRESHRRRANQSNKTAMKLVVVIAVLLSAVDGLPFRYSRFRRNVDPVAQELEFELLRNDADDYRPFNSFHSSDNVIYGWPEEDGRIPDQLDGYNGRIVSTPDQLNGFKNAVIRDNAPSNLFADFNNYGNPIHDETFGLPPDEAHFSDFDSNEIGTGSWQILPGSSHRKPIIKNGKNPIQIGDGAEPSSSEEVTPPATINNFDDGLVADDSDSVERDQPKLHSNEDDDEQIGTGAHVKPVKPVRVPTLPFTKKPSDNKNPIGTKLTTVNYSTTTPEPDSSKYIAPSEDSDQIDDDSEEDKNKNTVPVRHVIQLSSETNLMVLPDGVSLLNLSDADYQTLRKIFKN